MPRVGWGPEIFFAMGLARGLLLLICGTASAFYIYAVLAGRELSRRLRGGGNPESEPSVSILKPLRGLDHDAVSNFTSFCRQNYRSFEILFGAEDHRDPCLEIARQVASDHPGVDIRFIVEAGENVANPKVRTVSNLARYARHSLLLVSDSDIAVQPSYLRSMVAPLTDPSVGVVTCFYRTRGRGFVGRLDALSLSTEFLPGALVARRLEGMSFAMGAGILIRREVLDRIGGFPAIEDPLADDYLLGKLSHEAGYRVELARDVVDHRLGTRSLADLRARQNRWNLGIRTSRPWGYAGLVFTQGTLAALLLLAATGASALGWSVVAAFLAVRMASAAYLGLACLQDRTILRDLWLVPIRDLMAAGLWIRSFFGHTVVWRGRRLRVGAGGRILASG